MTEYQIGIDIRLPEDISDKIFNLKKRLGIFYLNNHEAQPHITIHIFKFKKKFFNKLLKEIQKLNLKKIRVKLSQLKTDNHKGKVFVYINVIKNKELDALHKKIVKICNLFRDNLIRFKDLEKINSNIYSVREIKQIKKFGYLRVMEFFKPHITLGVVEEKRLKPILQFFNNHLKRIDSREFEVDSLLIGLFRFDYSKNIFLEKYTIQKSIKLK